MYVCMYVCMYKAVQLKYGLQRQHSATWLAAARLPRLLYNRPAVFFRHLPSYCAFITEGKIRRACYISFLHFTAWVGNCVTWTHVSRQWHYIITLNSRRKHVYPISMYRFICHRTPTINNRNKGLTFPNMWDIYFYSTVNYGTII